MIEIQQSSALILRSVKVTIWRDADKELTDKSWESDRQAERKIEAFRRYLSVALRVVWTKAGKYEKYSRGISSPELWKSL